MKSLIYISEACQPFSYHELMELADKASAENTNHLITGFLCFKNNTFIQYLEGESIELGDLFTKISQDTRHKIINMIYVDDDGPRRFPKWHMRYVDSATEFNHNIEPFIFNLMKLMKVASVDGKEWHDMIWRGIELLARGGEKAKV